jgi:hypothetical protein
LDASLKPEKTKSTKENKKHNGIQVRKAKACHGLHGLNGFARIKVHETKCTDPSVVNRVVPNKSPLSAVEAVKI